MLNMTVRMPSSRKFVIWSICIIGLLIIAAFVIQGGGLVGEFSSSNAHAKFAKSHGWKISEKPVSEQNFTIPDNFDENMELYNEIQLAQGLDLRKFKGCKVTRYTYELYNYPNNPEGMRISFIVYDGNIIAGDIQSTMDSGFMHGFDFSGTRMELP